jgi:hypothetical protein
MPPRAPLYPCTILEHDEAKQNFVVVLPTGGMLIQSLRPTVDEDNLEAQTAIQEDSSHRTHGTRNQSSTTLTANRVSAALNGSGKIGPTRLTVQPFTRAVPRL